jgi:small ligand-binding sensory domain FIST
VKFASSQQRGDLATAARAAADEVERALAPGRVDLVLVFVSGYPRDGVAAAPAVLRARFDGATLAGCTASALIEGGQEMEGEPCLSVLAATLPDVGVHAAVLESPRGGLGPAAWISALGVDPDAAPALVVLAEPRSTPVDEVLAELDQAYPYSAKIGALVGTPDGDEALFCGGFVYRRGTLVLALTGDIQMDTVVAQGARPLGPAWVVTGAQGTVITSLEGRSALEVFAGVVAEASGMERHMMQRQPLIGVGAGSDWLIRNVLGAHPPSGSLVVGFEAETGQTVRFHVRDAASSRDDLDLLLQAWRRACPEGAAGVLLFPCLGRGRSFYGQPDVDAGLVARATGAPMAGCFAGGEIGQVKGKTWLHGYTATAALFRPAGWN